MHKADLRKKYKTLRKELGEEERVTRSKLVCSQLSNILTSNELVHCYLPIKRLFELDTQYFMDSYPKDQLVVSKSNFLDFSMTHYRYSSVSNWKESDYNIKEPVDGEVIEASEITAVLTPLLCADKNGNRVGYGAGFYDRFLSQCNPNCRKIGLTFFDKLEEIDDPNPKDIPLDYLVHPNGVIKF